MSCQPCMLLASSTCYCRSRSAAVPFGAPNALVAWGPPAGIAKALAVDGGYRVTGKWRFASGSANATWMGGHSTVFETADQPRRNERTSLTAFVQLARTKTSGGGLGSATVLRDNAVIQSGVARATGGLQSARAFLLQMLAEVWNASAASGALPLEQRAHLRLAITGAIEAARAVVDFAYRAAGTTAIFEGSPFERRFRDLHTPLAQGQAHLSNFESAGQALFGLEPAQRL